MDNPILSISITSHGLLPLAILPLLFNYAIGIGTSIQCHDPFMTNNPFASYNSSFQVSSIICKIVAGPLMVFVEDKNTLKWMFSVVILLLVYSRYELLYRTTPYFKWSAMRIAMTMTSCELAIALGFFLNCIFIQLEVTQWCHAIYIEIILMIILLRFSWLRVHNLAFEYISKPNRSLKNTIDVFKKLFALSFTHENAKTRSSGSDLSRTPNLSFMYLTGSVLNQQDLQEAKKDEIQILYYAEGEILQAALETFRYNNTFKLLYAYSLFKRKGILSRGIYTIFSIDSKKARLTDEINAFYLSRLFEEEMAQFYSKHAGAADHEINDKFLNIKKMVDSHEKSDLLLQLIEKNTLSYKQLWDYYNEAEMSVVTFLKKTIVLEKEAVKIETLWSELCQKSRSYSRSLGPFYGLYLGLVRSLPVTGEKIFTKCNRMIEQIKHLKNSKNPMNQLRLNGDDNMIFYISMSKEKLGRIRYASYSVHKELGWTPQELVGRNIKDLQPTYIKERHDMILHQYIEGNSNILNVSLESFVQTREGFLVPVDVYISQYPYIGAEPMHFGLLRKRRIQSEVMIVGPNGIIDSFTQGIGRALGMGLHKKIHIGQICGDYSKLNLRTLDSKPTISQTAFLSGSKLNIPEEPVETPETPIKNTLHKNIYDENEKQEMTLLLTSYAVNISTNKKKEILCSVTVQKHTIFGETYLHLYLNVLKTKDKNALEVSVTDLDAKKEPIPGSDDPGSEGLDELESILTDPPAEMMNHTGNTGIICESMGAGGQSMRNLLGDITERRTLEHIKIKQKKIEKTPQFPKKMMTTTITQVNTYKQLKSLRRTEVNTASEFRSQLGSTDRFEALDRKLDRLDLLDSRSSAAFSTASTRGKMGQNIRLEQAIYSIPDERFIKILDYLIVIFIVLCAGLVCLYVVYENTRLDSIAEVIDFTSSMQLRTSWMINLRIETQFIALVNQGVKKGTPTSIAIALYLMQYIVTTLASVNSQTVNSLYVIDTDLVQSLYNDRFDIIEDSTDTYTRQENNFELSADLINAGNNLIKLPFANITSSKPDVKFIVDNTINENVLSSDRAIKLIINDLKDDLNRVNFLALTLAVVTEIIGLTILVLLITDLRKFLRKRTQLIEVVLRLDADQINNHKRFIVGFYECIQKKNYEEDIYRKIKATYQDTNLQKAFKQEAKRTHKKAADLRGINTQMIRSVLLTMIGIILFGSIFLILSGKFMLDKEKFVKKIDTMVTVNALGGDLSLLSTIIFDYQVGGQNTLARGITIKEQVEYLLEKGQSIPQYYHSLETDGNDPEDILLREVMEGNLCKIPQISTLPEASCAAIGGGILTQGQIKVLSFMYSGFEESKNAFDSSNQTLAAASISLNLKAKLTGEDIGSYVSYANTLIRSLTKTQLQNSISNHQKDVINIIIVYALVYVGLALLLSLKIWRSIKKERVDWRKIIRHVPYSIISSSKLLKVYLVNNCHSSFDNVKSILG